MNTLIAEVTTAEQLESVELPGKWTELVRGQLIVREPPGTYHGVVSTTILVALATFVKARGSGVVVAQDSGFRIGSNPDTVRAPDAAYVNAERAQKISRRGYSSVAPNIAVEVLSPDDRPAEVLQKIADWLEAGVELVWILDPDRREARVHRADGSVAIVDAAGHLDGELVLPGFTFPVTELFDQLPLKPS